ncbi:MAG: dTMP kinase [Aigarchaeota archaeon]|nr:dTMP kinase [Aigarchaeota archaeon]MDW8092904.1 dTMP kinase [Nitrososphaerota archaeon]
MREGALIVVEGIDGAGKTLNARWIVRYLRRRGREVIYTKEPTDGAIGRLLRDWTPRRVADPRVDALLFSADRLHHLRRVIEPEIAKGKVIVSDRYMYSTIAYQGAMLKDRGWVEELNRFARIPDLSIYLDVDPELGLRRKMGVRRYSEEDVEILRRVRKVYLELVNEEELESIDANRDLDQVREDISKLIDRLIS